MIGSLVSAFAGGFALETSSVFWVHFSERNQRNALTVVSALQATALACGIGNAIRGWLLGCAFVAGYALGANAGSRLKLLFSPSDPEGDWEYEVVVKILKPGTLAKRGVGR